MRIGMSLTTSFSRTRDSSALMESLTEQVKLMADLGFDSLSLGDHHLTHDHYFQVLPTMSCLAAHSGNMQLLPLFLLPFYNPLLLAEQIATLDVISHGRTALICGLGHQPEAHVAFQTPQRRRVSRFVETFEIMRLLWGQDDVTYSGKHYSLNPGVSISPKPLQPHLPMWIGAEAEPAIQRTAELADGWVITPGWTPDVIEDRIRFYRAALNAGGRADTSPDIVLRRDAHLATTREEARRQAQNLYQHGYRGFPQKEMEESLIVGGPDDCIGYLKNMERLGVSHVLFRCALNQREQALQTIQVIGSEVIPRFR